MGQDGTLEKKARDSGVGSEEEEEESRDGGGRQKN